MTDAQEAFGRGGGFNPDDWGTPWPLFRAVDARFHFTLDPCAIAENAKVPGRFFSPEQDGLRQDWGGVGTVAWVNPPYGRGTPLWMEKAIREAGKGATVVFLVFVRSDTTWWHASVTKAAEVWLLRGRVKFTRPGMPDAGAPMPSCLVVFTPESVRADAPGPRLGHWWPGKQPPPVGPPSPEPARWGDLSPDGR